MYLEFFGNGMHVQNTVDNERLLDDIIHLHHTNHPGFRRIHDVSVRALHRLWKCGGQLGRERIFVRSSGQGALWKQK